MRGHFLHGGGQASTVALAERLSLLLSVPVLCTRRAPGRRARGSRPGWTCPSGERRG